MADEGDLSVIDIQSADCRVPKWLEEISTLSSERMDLSSFQHPPRQIPLITKDD